MKLQRNGRTKALAIGALAVVSSLSLAACGSDDNTKTGSNTSASSSAGGASAGGAAADCGKGGQLLGAGSTAQANAIEVWKAAFQAKCSGTVINYNGNGSGAGVANFNQGKVAFAGSDAALKPEEVDASKKVCAGGQGIDLPMVGGAVAIAYNVDGVDNLVLDAQTTAKIFDSKITKWNDPAIAKLNPGVKLPDANIQAFHRSDDSGTTKNLTAYFAAAAGKSAWPYEPDKKWAGKGGQAATGSAGLAGQVKQQKNSITYVELSYAQTNSLKTAKIATGAAQPVEATAEAAAKTIGLAKVKGTGSDLALSLDYATKADGAYPLVLVTYEIVCDKGNKPETLPGVKAFLNYTISDEAQQAIADKGYVPLPAEVAGKVKAVIPTLA
ncbi:phosphate ABC transporter substrate-binding protein PstS [Streptacidiphilus sp. ASG 303]|uniref:phosphate ABC transporter substrate-binding protein PstS n=1 Tax=Streptomycetaceae TaxID=2062 RepID=UPI001E36814C|nr:phosphate ABC transporter substrate-binding protein PstS [Streptacidiphilus sp. ASG 303]MCD0485605.1 phosphate ABC transporter substrate-binding protein PstS [Streptacidiphilus sp. ASG 303]